MSKWEIKKNSSSDGKSEVYENGVKIGTISKERGIPFISSDQAVVRNSSGDKIGIVSSQDDGVIGGLLGHKKTIVDDLRKKRISNPEFMLRAPPPVSTTASNLSTIASLKGFTVRWPVEPPGVPAIPPS